MATPSGIDAQLGLSRESAYGVYTAPTWFPPFLDESLAPNFGTIESKALGRPGSNRFSSSHRRARTAQGAGGDLKFELTEAGFEPIFEQLMGTTATVTTPSGGTLSRLKRYTPGAGVGSLTAQLGRPDVNGVVRPFTFLGLKCVSWSLDVQVDGYVELTTTWDGKAEDTAQTLVSYVAPSPEPGILSYVGSTIKVGGVDVPVRSLSIKVDNGLKTQRRFIGGVVKSPAAAGMRTIEVNFDADFDGMTLYNLISSGALTDLAVAFGGSLIETGHFYGVNLTIPALQLDGDPPKMSLDDVATHSIKATGLYNGAAEAITLDYLTVV
jgi:hypothetical protein